MSTSVAANAVNDVIALFVSEDKIFSAYDVTEEVRKSGDARHYDVKSIVHGLYMAGQLGNNLYSRELVVFNLGSDDADVFVYHPHSKSPYDHPLARKQTVRVPVDTDDDDTDGVTVIVTDEHRIQIPQKVLEQVTPDQTTQAYDLTCNGNTILRKAESDGRVRITETSFPIGAKLNVTVDGDTIQISPM